jgi:hypothetical protein
MKNVYNLITDAFVRIGEDETKYSITVEYTESESELRSYGIVIKSLDASVIGSACVVLLLSSSNQLVDYYEVNDLFYSWDRFCDVFEWQI